MWFTFNSKDKNYDITQFATIIDNFDFSTISGESTILEPFEKKYPTLKKKSMHFAEFSQLNESFDLTKKIYKATVDQLDELMELKKTIQEFEIIKDKAMVKKNIEEGMTEIYYIQENDKIVSSAETTAENSESAMIIGVCTDENHRNRGYASQLMVQICKEFIEKNKKLCLFYDNPAAGKIYKRIGFQDIGQWTMLQKIKT